MIRINPDLSYSISNEWSSYECDKQVIIYKDLLSNASIKINSYIALNDIKWRGCIIIIDKMSKELYIARDKIGFSNVYFSLISDNIFISDNLSDLYGEINLSLSKKWLYYFLRFGFTSQSISMFDEIRSLETSEVVVFKEFEKVKSDFLYKEKRKRNMLNENDAVNSINNRLSQIMTSNKNKKIKILLSGGIDSTLLATQCFENGIKPECFIIRFSDDDESRFAIELAEYLKFEYSIIKYNISDFNRSFENICRDSNIPIASPSTLVFADILKQLPNGLYLNGAFPDEALIGYDYEIEALRKYHIYREIAGLMGNVDIQNETHGLLSDFLKRERPMHDHSEYIPYFLESFDVYDVFGLDQKEDIFPFDNNDPFESIIDFQLDFLFPETQLSALRTISLTSKKEFIFPYLDDNIRNIFFSLDKKLLINNGLRKYILHKCANTTLKKRFSVLDKTHFSVPIHEWFVKDMDHILGFFPEKLHGFIKQEIKRDYKGCEKVFLLLSLSIWLEKREIDLWD